jgi:hypothetical protein
MSRKLFRKFAQSKGSEAKEFVKIEDDYGFSTLITKDESGRLERLTFNYRELCYWLMNNFKKLSNDS